MIKSIIEPLTIKDIIRNYNKISKAINIPENILFNFEVIPYKQSNDILYVVAYEENSLAVSILEKLTKQNIVLLINDKTVVDDSLKEIKRLKLKTLKTTTYVNTNKINKVVTVEETPELMREEEVLIDDGIEYHYNDAESLEDQKIGKAIIDQNLATKQEVSDVIKEHKRTGSSVGKILLHDQIIKESDLLALQAYEYKIPFTDIYNYEYNQDIVKIIPEELARTKRVVPLVEDGDDIYFAVAKEIDKETLNELKKYTNKNINTLLTSAKSIDRLLQQVYNAQYIEEAKMNLVNNSPTNSAHQVLSTGQKIFFILLIIVSIIGLILFPLETAIIFIALSSLFYLATSLYKLNLTFSALSQHYEIEVTEEEIAALDEKDLPIYTILVPLYKEAAVIPKLLKGISQLDYPKTKLDVRLLCEEDDDETIEAIKKLQPPPHFKLVVVPDSQPKTKPKACNYGLVQADGDLVVIYDAEDRPEPTQLKKAVIAFEKSDKGIICIQAKLNYFNQDQNILTRWFATEYAMWFDLLLPGLASKNVPIPLGGTSNHFKTEHLKDLGAWDPFNVTEDADLGIRLHKAGYSTAIIDSTTLEEANSDVHNWIRQRSRWIKGYIQTWLVHMRNPIRLLSQIGVKDFISFNLVVGGTFIFLLNPIYWGLTTLFLFTQWGLIQALFPSFIFYIAAAMLFIGNAIFVYFNVAGSIQRGYFGLAKYALFSPIYWGLMSWAAWKGFIQLFTKPFYWEKTIHGLDNGGTDEG